MALSFTPQFHTEVEAGRWTRTINQLAPFGAYPSMEVERKAFQEAKQIEDEGDSIVVIDFKR